MHLALVRILDIRVYRAWLTSSEQSDWSNNSVAPRARPASLYKGARKECTITADCAWTDLQTFLTQEAPDSCDKYFCQTK